MNSLHSTIHHFVRRHFQHTFGQPAQPPRTDSEWDKLRATGTRLWLDTGDADEAAQLWCTAFDGLTTNNTLLNKEIQKGIYDQLIQEAAHLVRQLPPREQILEIAFILNAYHGLRLVERFDAFVSVELHTDLAHDVAGTVSYGRRFHAICPERFYVKVPLTPAGYLGARQLAAAGIPINFTLGFSARQNYLAALLTRPAYCNVFMGRLNSFVADNQLGSGKNVGEKATLATQRVLRQLRAAGRTTTQLIGASIRAGQQIADLAGLDIFTMPPKAAAEYRAQPPAAPRVQLDADPDIPLANGVTPQQFAGHTLWDLPDRFRAAVDALPAHGITPRELQQHFANAGFPDFLPDWSPTDIEIVSADGKIPVFTRWADRLASGQIGLDALMNLSALHSFVADQTALDNRIRGLLR